MHLRAKAVSILNCDVELCCVRIDCIDKDILVIPVYIPTQRVELSGNALQAKYESIVRIIEQLSSFTSRIIFLVLGTSI